VQSLERGLAIIRAFGPDQPELTVTEIAGRTALTRAATRRFLLTLSELGYVESDGRHFRLTPRVLELGYAYLSGLSMPDVALPHMERLVAEVQESSEASLLDGEDIVYVVRVPSASIMTISINIGARMPAYATAMGRVLLAGLDDDALERFLATARLVPLLPRTITDPAALREELERVRGDGYAIIDQELEEGLRAVAVPLHDRSGRVTAAINLSTHVARHTVDSIRTELLSPLQRTARAIEADMAGVITPPARRLGRR
jgi:IclR family pca regulon transcriptional regulator